MTQIRRVLKEKGSTLLAFSLSDWRFANEKCGNQRFLLKLKIGIRLAKCSVKFNEELLDKIKNDARND
jgi:hypothetical protein